MIFQCLMSNSNFSLQIQTFSNLRKVVQIKPNQISNVKFKSNSNQTSFEAFPRKHLVLIGGFICDFWFWHEKRTKRVPSLTGTPENKPF